MVETIDRQSSEDINDKSPAKMDDKELLELFNKKIDGWFTCFKDNIIDGRDRKRFAFGDQWEDVVAEEYRNVGKVMLTTNKLNPYLRRLVGEVRAFTPALAVKRTDELIKDDKLPKILENHIRKISMDSDAKTSYQTAFRNATVQGWGVLDVALEFKNNKSFEQKIIIKENFEPEKTGFDPSAKNLTKSDGDYCFDYERMSKDEFKNQHGFIPDFDGQNSIDFNDGKFCFEWMNDEQVTVVNFYLKEYFDKTLVRVAHGETFDRKEYNKMAAELEKMEEENPNSIDPSVYDDMKIVQTRKVSDYKVKYYQFIKNKILERSKWGSKLLPKIFVDGDSYWLDGQQHTQPFIKDAMDSQRMLNFVNTEIVQNIKDANKEDYMGTPDNIKGHEKQWKDKRRRKGLLVANPDRKTGQLPVKQPPAQINPQLHPLSVKFEGDIRSCLGIFESNQGAGEKDLSGVAELTRITQGNLSSFVYVSNLTKSIEQAGRVILDLIKNTKQSTGKLAGIDEAGEETTGMINQPNAGGQIENNISEGDFDVAISASSAFTIQKMQEYREILSYISAFPNMAQVIPDIAALKLGTDSKFDIAKRAAGTLPLEVQAQDKDNPEQAAQAQKALQQQQQIKQLMQQMTMMGEKIKLMAEKQKGDAAEKTSSANMMNALTNRQGESMKAPLEVAKLHTEMQKSADELEKEHLKFAGTLASKAG